MQLARDLMQGRHSASAEFVGRRLSWVGCGFVVGLGQSQAVALKASALRERGASIPVWTTLGWQLCALIVHSPHPPSHFFKSF